MDTQVLVPEARARSVGMQDRKGIKVLLEPSRDRLLRLSQPWLDAGYTGEGKGADRVQKVLGWTAQMVRHPPRLAPDDVMKLWERVGQ